MTQKSLDPSKPQLILKDIHEGMDVFDRHSRKIGSVDELYFGASSDEMERHGSGAATAPNPDLRDESLVEDVARAFFDEDELPEEMRQRLINDGFIRLNSSGLFAADRYVLPEQIDHVAADQVYLNVTRDQLLKK